MSGIVTLEVTRGELAHKTFAYAEKARVFIGRQEDCGIVLPESTVSRYHCVLEILPPVVKLQDFGSLNGTYLNGEMIGKRDKNQPWEQAKDEEHTVYLLKDGDVLGLGSRCELRCSIEEVENCAICGVEMKHVIRPMAKYLAVVLVGIIIVAMVPPLTTWLPGLAGY